MRQQFVACVRWKRLLRKRGGTSSAAPPLPGSMNGTVAAARVWLYPRWPGQRRRMTEFGYTAMCEQTPVRQLVSDLVAAEEAGFDFSVMSDHYFPWIEEQGHSGYAWSVLGAAAQATSRLPLMTFVTCPTFRYHPAVVAQKAATMGILSGGRFTLGLGAGERLNEHVIGGGWPSARIRHQRLAEAAEIIRDLFSGDYVNYSGRYFEVDHARLFDLPDTPVPIGIAVSGPESIQIAASHGDAMIATEPDGELVAQYAQAGKDALGTGSCPCATGRTRPLAARGPGNCGGGRCRAGTSWPSCRTSGPLPPPASRSPRTKRPNWCRAAPTPGGTSKPPASGSRPGSPTWPWSRSAQTSRLVSWNGPRANYCPSCASSAEYRSGRSVTSEEAQE